MTAGVPLFVDLSGRRVVIVGGGTVAAAKADALVQGGPDLLVVAPQLDSALSALVDDGRAEWAARRFTDTDLDGAWLAVAATSSPAVNARVVAAADERRVWCVRVDDAEGGTAAVIAAVHRGPLLLAVSTSGTAPALAARIRADLAARYGPEWGELATLMGELRRDPTIRATLAELPAHERRRRWRAVIDPDIVDLIRSGRRNNAKEVAAACLCSSSD